MALLLRPHTATVRVPTKVSDANGDNTHTKGFELGAGTSVRGQLDYLSMADALADFGVETSAGARWFCNTGDAANVQVGYELTVGGVRFVVVSGPMRHTHGFGLDHLVYLLERVGDA